MDTNKYLKPFRQSQHQITNRKSWAFDKDLNKEFVTKFIDIDRTEKTKLEEKLDESTKNPEILQLSASPIVFDEPEVKQKVPSENSNSSEQPLEKISVKSSIAKEPVLKMESDDSLKAKDTMPEGKSGLQTRRKPTVRLSDSEESTETMDKSASDLPKPVNTFINFGANTQATEKPQTSTSFTFKPQQTSEDEKTDAPATINFANFGANTQATEKPQTSTSFTFKPQQTSEDEKTDAPATINFANFGANTQATEKPQTSTSFTFKPQQTSEDEKTDALEAEKKQVLDDNTDLDIEEYESSVENQKHSGDVESDDEDEISESEDDTKEQPKAVFSLGEQSKNTPTFSVKPIPLQTSIVFNSVPSTNNVFAKSAGADTLSSESNKTVPVFEAGGHIAEQNVEELFQTKECRVFKLDKDTSSSNGAGDAQLKPVLIETCAISLKKLDDNLHVKFSVAGISVCSSQITKTTKCDFAEKKITMSLIVPNKYEEDESAPKFGLKTYIVIFRYAEEAQKVKDIIVEYQK